MKHSPGPWKPVKGDGQVVDALMSIVDMNDIEIGKACQHWTEENSTSDGYKCSHGKSWEEITANTRLMAAGPELLRACQLAVETIQILVDTGMSNSFALVGLHEKLVRVIHKTIGDIEKEE